jgi:hypothetical protein
MKRIFILLIGTLLVFTGSAQKRSKVDSWEIFHNRKEIASFKFAEDNDERKVLLLNRSLDEPGFLIITYKPAKEHADWVRSYVITDSTGNELKKFDKTAQLRSHNSEIARLVNGRGKIQIYSWAVPKDPNEAAAVRVRRILLCTIYTR